MGFMNRISRTVAVVVVAWVASASASVDQSYGAGVKLTEATPIQKLYEHPETFIGKTIRVDGAVVSVCEEMGCWMAIADAASADYAVRVVVDHSKGIVFPMTAKGKPASAEGVFAKSTEGDHEAADAANGLKAKHPKAAAFVAKYEIKMTGAVVR
jgi:hypothetical protein